MVILYTLNFLAAGFLGYVAGRWGDNHLNFWMKDPHWTPHHWIYGLMIITFGTFYLNSGIGLWILCFGVGLFASDLKDFLDFRLIGKDNKDKNKVRFWHID